MCFIRDAAYHLMNIGETPLNSAITVIKKGNAKAR
jgi:hypothetical protein